jgi:hypothetical protein
MTELIKIKLSELTKKHFEDFPVWAWAEDPIAEDLVSPVLETHPIPVEAAADFIKAEFQTPSGLRFDGYVIDADAVFAINLFIDHHQVVFNVQMDRAWVERGLAELRTAIGDQEAQIFPLTYKSEYRLSDGTIIAGEFDPFKGE